MPNWVYRVETRQPPIAPDVSMIEETWIRNQGIAGQGQAPLPLWLFAAMPRGMQTSLLLLLVEIGPGKLPLTGVGN